MRRHDFIVHFASHNPFEQFVYRAHLNASERRKLDAKFQRGLKDWTVHSYRIEDADVPVACLSTLLEELDDLRT